MISCDTKEANMEPMAMIMENPQADVHAPSESTLEETSQPEMTVQDPECQYPQNPSPTIPSHVGPFEEQYSCPIPGCTKSYYSKSGLVFHIKQGPCVEVHKNAKSGRFHCPIPGCRRAYLQISGLRYHLQKGFCKFVNEQRGFLKERQKKVYSLEEVDTDINSMRYPCPIPGCQKAYMQVNGLNYHILKGTCEFVNERQGILKERGANPQIDQEFIATKSDNSETESYQSLEKLLSKLRKCYDQCRPTVYTNGTRPRSLMDAILIKRLSENVIDSEDVRDSSENTEITKQTSSERSRVYFAEKCCIVINARPAEDSMSDVEYITDAVTRELSCKLIADTAGDLRFSMIRFVKVSDRSIRLLYDCHCKWAQFEKRNEALVSLPGAPCCIPGCPMTFPVLQPIQKELPPKCWGLLDVTVEIESHPDASKLKAGTTIIFTHPVVSEPGQSSEEWSPASQANMIQAHKTEMGAAVFRDMQLLDDPQFSAYIGGCTI